jgi:uncharacterized membrane protein YccC
MIALSLIGSFLAGAIAALGVLYVLAAWEERKAGREIERMIAHGREEAKRFLSGQDGQEWLEEIRHDREAR